MINEDLKTKLRKIISANKKPAHKITYESFERNLEEYLQAEVQKTPFGSCLVRHDYYPNGHRHGISDIHSFLSYHPEVVAKLTGIPSKNGHSRNLSFNTAFHDEDYFFYVFETGITPQLDSANGPLQGAYRIGLWNDPQPKGHSDASPSYSGRDDVGFYLSCGQLLMKENADPEDSQGFGVFFRYGYASSKRNDMANFWSVGFQYQGLLEGRDDDVLGAGFAQGIFSDKASSTYTDDYESVIELYYNAQVTPWLNISPSAQYIANPGGSKTVSDAVVLGERAQINL